MKKLILILLALTMTPLAQAGGGHGGSGGDGYLCAKPKDDMAWPPYDLRLVDTYGDTSLDEIVHDNELALIDPFGMRTLARFLNRKMPAAVYPHPFKAGVKIPFGTLILLRNLQIYFYQSDLEQLPDIKDDNIRWWQIPRGCKKVQLAIQDIKTSTVRMSEQAFLALPLIDDLFLRLHETLISLRNQPGLDTTPVRRDVERLAEMIRTHRADFVRGLTADFEKAITVPETTPPLTMPRTLRCQLTWRMPRIDVYQPKFELSSTFLLTRTSGSGEASAKNVYKIQTASGLAATSTSTNMLPQPTIYSSTRANMINAFETKFELTRGVTYTLGLYDHVDEAGVYIGSVQASFTDQAIARKSRQENSQEEYDSAGVICVQAP